MTRRSDLMCEDIFDCDHRPETPIVKGSEIVSWVCRCGTRKHDVGSCRCPHCATASSKNKKND